TLEAVFSSLAARDYVDLDTQRLLLERRDEVIAGLLPLLGTREIRDEAVGAALMLCKFHNPRGRRYLVRALESGSKEVRLRVLQNITHGWLVEPDAENQQTRFMTADPALNALLLKQLEDPSPDVVKAAIQTCGYLQVPGVYDALLKLAERPDAPDRGRILFWLSKGPLTSAVLKAALASLPAEDYREDRWEGMVLDAFARHEDPQLREPAREWLKRRLAVWQDEGMLSYSSNRLGLLETLAETSDARDTAWLQETAERERGLYAQAPLVALVRLEGDAGKARLLAMLASPAT